MTGLWVLLAALVVATAVGLTLRHRDGRFRPARDSRQGIVPQPGARDTASPVPDVATAPAPTAANAAGTPDEDGTPAGDGPGADGRRGEDEVPAAGSLNPELVALGEQAGERATLLQFSTAFCAPCRTTRGVLADVARIVPGVAHVEVDAEAHLDLVRRLGIRRTPTVLVLDGAGRELSRASGAPPSRAAVIAALDAAAD